MAAAIMSDARLLSVRPAVRNKKKKLLVRLETTRGFPAVQVYHLNVIYRDKIVPDFEGSAFIDLNDAKREAFASICLLAAQDLERANPMEVRRVDVVSPQGTKLHSVGLAEVIAKVIPFDDDEFFFEVTAILEPQNNIR